MVKPAQAAVSSTIACRNGRSRRSSPRSASASLRCPPPQQHAARLQQREAGLQWEAQSCRGAAEHSSSAAVAHPAEAQREGAAARGRRASSRQWRRSTVSTACRPVSGSDNLRGFAPHLGAKGLNLNPDFAPRLAVKGLNLNPDFAPHLGVKGINLNPYFAPHLGVKGFNLNPDFAPHLELLRLLRGQAVQVVHVRVPQCMRAIHRVLLPRCRKPSRLRHQRLSCSPTHRFPCY